MLGEVVTGNCGELATQRELSLLSGRSITGVRSILYDSAIRPSAGGKGSTPGLYSVDAFFAEVNRRAMAGAGRVAQERKRMQCPVCGETFKVNPNAKCVGKIVCSIGCKKEHKRSRAPATIDAARIPTKPLDQLIRESVFEIKPRYNLLTTTASRTGGGPAKRREPNRKGGPSFGAQSKCSQCGEIYWRTGQKMWHNTRCKKEITRQADCQWCGTKYLKRDAKQKYCGNSMCASLGIHYGTPEVREAEAALVYDCIIIRGMSAGATVRETTFSPNKVWVLLEYRCGSMARQWAKDRQATISPVGFKGKGKAKPIPMQALMKTRWSKERTIAAQCIRMVRKGADLSDVATHAGCTNSSVADFLNRRSPTYKRMSKKRLSRSEWRTKESNAMHRSALYPRESVFRDASADILRGGGYSVTVECCVAEGSRQRVDVVAEMMGVKFAVEAKCTGRSSRVDQCIGQAIRKSANMGAHPVVLLPSDVRVSDHVLSGIAAMNAAGLHIRMCSESNICTVLSMDVDEWVDHCGDTDAFGEWRKQEYKAALTAAMKAEGAVTYDPCPTCGQEFRRYKTMRQTYCSRECARARV